MKMTFIISFLSLHVPLMIAILSQQVLLPGITLYDFIPITNVTH